MLALAHEVPEHRRRYDDREPAPESPDASASRGGVV